MENVVLWCVRVTTTSTTIPSDERIRLRSIFMHVQQKNLLQSVTMMTELAEYGKSKVTF